MKVKKPNEQYQTVTLFVRYFDDGKMEYCNPYTGDILFTKQSPTGTSPIVELSSGVTEESPNPPLPIDRIKE